MIVKTKECIKCHEEKPLYMFTINRKSSDKLTHKCNECIKLCRTPSELERIRKNSPPITNDYWSNKTINPG